MYVCFLFGTFLELLYMLFWVGMHVFCICFFCLHSLMGDLNHTNFLMGPWEILFEWYYFITKLYTHPWDLNPQPHLHLYLLVSQLYFLFVLFWKIKKAFKKPKLYDCVTIAIFIFQILYLVLYYDAYDELLGFPFKT